MIRSCENADVDMYVVPASSSWASGRGVTTSTWSGVPPRAAAPVDPPVLGPLAKRVFDSGISAVMLALVAPIYAVLALGVKFSSPGPVYFRQQRIGKNGRVVEVLKFRSMRVNSQSETQWTMGEDERVTKVGRLMRKTSLDELLSSGTCCGATCGSWAPAERPFFVDQFEKAIPRYMTGTGSRWA